MSLEIKMLMESDGWYPGRKTQLVPSVVSQMVRLVANDRCRVWSEQNKHRQ